MMYGEERNDVGVLASWRKLLLEYCKLDTLAMVLIWEHRKRATAKQRLEHYLVTQN